MKKKLLAENFWNRKEHIYFPVSYTHLDVYKRQMYFFLGMSDAEIGDKMKIDRSTSFRIRKSSLDKIGKKLKENTENE